MFRNSAAVLFIVFIVIFATGAAWAFLRDRNELSEYFCADLNDTAVYDRYKIDHYKILIPGRNGWIFRTENDFRNKWDTKNKTVNYFLRLQQAMNTHNAQLVVVIPPMRGLVHADRLFKKDRKKYGLENTDAVWQDYEDMLATLRDKGLHVVGASKDQVTPDFYYSRNHHWSASGARVVAQNVAQEVKQLENYAEIPTVEFETSQKEEPVSYPSSFSKGFEKICGTEIPDEEAIQYETTPKAGVAGESELFESREEPQIVLLGTSNSVLGTSYANFEGFLKEYLSRDILNSAYIGAGIDTSIMAYLNSEHFRDDRPKIVIWEIPGYYDLNIMDDKLFNQVIPAAYGACAAPLLSRSFDAVGPGTLTLWSGSQNPQPAGPPENSEILPQSTMEFSDIAGDTADKYLHLSFSEPIKDKFNVRFEYEDGGTKKQEFSRDDRYPHDGSFYTLFSSNGDKELSKIFVYLPKDFSAAALEVKVCVTP